MAIKKNIKVSVRVSNGSLQIVYRYGIDPKRPTQRKRHCKGLGLKDTPTNRTIAEGIALQLQSAFISGTQDQFLATLNTDPDIVASPIARNLLEVWGLYEEHYSRFISDSTFCVEYSRFARPILERNPHWTTEDEIKILRAIKPLTPGSQQKFCRMLRACIKWAIVDRLIESSPLDQIRVQVPRHKKRQINCFTLAERDRIIAAFAASPTYCHYKTFVQFLFLTGCRPSEAAGFPISNIRADVVVFSQSVNWSKEGKRRVTPGLKTQDRREFPINGKLAAVLAEAVGDRKSGLLFSTTRGKTVNTDAFRTHAWAICLAEAGVPYRHLYTTRHTFITYCLRNGVPVAEVARWVGNSPQIIFSNYAAAIGDMTVPEF